MDRIRENEETHAFILQFWDGGAGGDQNRHDGLCCGHGWSGGDVLGCPGPGGRLSFSLFLSFCDRFCDVIVPLFFKNFFSYLFIIITVRRK